MSAPTPPGAGSAATAPNGGSPAPATRTASLRNILVNLGWLLGGKGVAGLLSLVYLGIVTRSLGVEGFGQFSLAAGTAQAVASFAGFQSWQIIVRYGMPHLHAGREEALRRLIRFTTLLDATAAAVGAALATGAILLLSGHFGWSRAFAHQAAILSVVMVLATHWTPIGVLRLHDRFGTGAAADTTTSIVRFVGSLIVWLTGPTVIGFLTVWALAEVLTAASYWTLAVRTPGFAWRLAEPLRWRVLKDDNPGLPGYALTTNLSSSLDLGGRQLAVLLVGLFASPAAAGAFRFAQQLAASLAKVSQLLARAIFPELVRSRAATTDRKDFDRLLGRTARLTAIGAAIVFGLLLLIGRPAVRLIAGQAFLGAYPVLLVLGSASALDFAAVGFEPAVIALGRPGLALKLRFVSTAVLIALMVTLPVRFGAIGAGFAVLAGSITSFALLWQVVGRHIRRRPR